MNKYFEIRLGSIVLCLLADMICLIYISMFQNELVKYGEFNVNLKVNSSHLHAGAFGKLVNSLLMIK